MRSAAVCVPILPAGGSGSSGAGRAGSADSSGTGVAVIGGAERILVALRGTSLRGRPTLGSGLIGTVRAGVGSGGATCLPHRLTTTCLVTDGAVGLAATALVRGGTGGGATGHCAASCGATGRGPTAIGGSIGIEPIRLGELLIHGAALLLDRRTLLIGLLAATLGGHLLLLGRLRLLLRVQTGTVGLELGLLRRQVALLDGSVLRLRFLPELVGAPTVFFLLLGLPALRGLRAHHDQNDQEDEHYHDDSDEDGQ